MSIPLFYILRLLYIMNFFFTIQDNKPKVGLHITDDIGRLQVQDDFLMLR